MGPILKKEVRRTLLKWNPINERIMSTRFNSSFAKLIIIHVYAPSSDAYEVEATPRHDVLIVMGDLNAKIGEDNEGWKSMLERHGLERMNENGERLATYCCNNNLMIGGSLFKHKDIHKITWNSPNTRHQNQINHMIINCRYRKIEERRKLKEKIKRTRSARLKKRILAAYAVKDKEVKANARADTRSG